MPGVTVRLAAAPRTGGTATFSFGCGPGDGKSTCALGAVDAKSAQRQLQAKITVPATASSVKSVSLTVSGSATHLAKDPKVSAAVSITAPPAPATTPATTPPTPAPASSIGLPSGILPTIASARPSVNPGGNAASLFPVLAPNPTTSPAGTTGSSPAETGGSAATIGTRQVANTTALPEGVPVVGAQLVGLAALALAFVLAVARLSVRRPALARRSKSAGAAPAPPAESPDTAAEQPGEDD